jgi:plasmid maintenance system antidote protein VapI
MYFEHGDEADLQLIRCAHNIAEEFVERLVPQFDTQKVFGVTVQNFFDFAEMKFKAGEEIYLPKVYALQE